ncbi:hypothetical protein SAMN04488528_104820 [Clostridium frigidicarnis]|uniref:Uncharacterized protein n=1 Tax=Clostridium frigidicarnis TaxID=84698 RepID=A0A1I1AV43_9CLOT|nr:hypothetical protein SAMN04488528_104820 [Clostridium frigidicarnis]
MENILYKKLLLDKCKCINEMDPSQYIGKAWRQVV